MLIGAAVASRTTRNKEMGGTYPGHGYRQEEIGPEPGMHYATVRRIIRAVEERKSPKKACPIFYLRFTPEALAPDVLMVSWMAG
jgi:hypothetical protein